MDDFVRDSARTSTNAEQLVSQLREAILRGTLRPGDRLHQDRLAEDMGVSRTPLRTALTTLAQAGLVRYETNRGFRVREFSLEEMMHGLRLRAELEALACRLYAARITDDEVARLQFLVDLGDDILSDGTLHPDAQGPYRQMNVEFHTTILRGSGNPWLVNFVDQLHAVPLVSDRVVIWEDYAAVQRSHDDHRRIVRAFAVHDGERAARLMMEHVVTASETLMARIKEHPEEFLSPPAEATPVAAGRPRLG